MILKFLIFILWLNVQCSTSDEKSFYDELNLFRNLYLKKNKLNTFNTAMCKKDNLNIEKLNHFTRNSCKIPIKSKFYHSP